MKLETYQANLVIVNQNTDPKRHGVCGNDGIISFSPPILRDAFMAEHAALVAVAEAAHAFAVESPNIVTVDRLAKSLAALTTLRAGQPATGSEVVDHRPLVEALDKIASWSEGDEVSSRFDEPYAAKIAREALATVGVVGGMTGSEVAK